MHLTPCEWGAHCGAHHSRCHGGTGCATRFGSPAHVQGEQLHPWPGERNQEGRSYLDYSAFSRQGLIEQLEDEEFSPADATFAVDHVTVDWNEQAVKKAESYLDYSSFSKQGLIEQLEYEGFTQAQAQYGADAAYGS